MTRIARRGILLGVLLLLPYGGWRLWYALGYTHPQHRLDDLPLSEVPAPGDGDVLVVLLTSDAGWAELDEKLSRRLAEAGIPTVAWNSFLYYLRTRPPREGARDLARVIEAYSRTWERQRVVLVGYSFGADVLPFLVDRLPADVRERVDGVVLLAFADDAVFRFHPAGWFGRVVGDAYPTIPEVAKLGLPLLCMEGRDDPNGACRSLRPYGAEVVILPAPHRLGPVSDRVTPVVLRAIRRWSAPDRPPSAPP